MQEDPTYSTQETHTSTEAVHTTGRFRRDFCSGKDENRAARRKQAGSAIYLAPLEAVGGVAAPLRTLRKLGLPRVQWGFIVARRGSRS